jgi:hypothetical protein
MAEHGQTAIQKRAADLFAKDGSYQITPFLAPASGRSAILEYWSQVAETERNVHFDYR